MTEQKKIKVFLKNGFKYEGYIIKLTKDFLTFHDSYDDKTRTIPMTNVSTMEDVGDKE